MASYSDRDRDRDRPRRRRPQYYDSDSDSIDDIPPPRPRRRSRPPPRDAQPEPQPAPRRPSILVDPDETASQRERRRPRSKSNVRVKASSDEDSDHYERPRRTHDRGIDQTSRASRHDLERKNSQENRKFREKRNGYESEEGETLKKASMGSSDKNRREYDDGRYADEYKRRDRPPRDTRDDMSLPLRGKPRDPADAEGGAPRPSNLQRRRTYKDTPKDRDRRRYDDSDYDDPPRRDDPKSLRPPPRYEDREHGYRSDAARRPPRPRRRDDYDDRDDYRPRRDEGGYRSGPEQQRPRFQDYYSDYRDDRARRSDPRERRDRDRDRDRYRDDDRYRDYDRRRYGDSDRDRPKLSRRGTAGMAGWQKEASAAFMTYAMPVIKKEGTKYVKKEIQKLLAKQAGGG